MADQPYDGSELSLQEFEGEPQESFEWGFNEVVNLPNDQQRLVIVGSTGTGKTHAALWHLSRRDFDVRPWIIYDYKYDDLINSIEGVIELGINSPVPKEPGLYVVHPDPEEKDELELQMRAIWRAENIGVYVDEGYMVGDRNNAFRALLTQGRSKHIPMIVLSQRPVWMDKFVFTESEFFQVFRLQNIRDVDRMEEFIPFSLNKRLPEYHSYYYDVAANKLNILRAVPDRRAILSAFDTKMAELGPRKI